MFKIPNISTYSSFEYSGETISLFRNYNIGSGEKKKISCLYNISKNNLNEIQLNYEENISNKIKDPLLKDYLISDVVQLTTAFPLHQKASNIINFNFDKIDSSKFSAIDKFKVSYAEKVLDLREENSIKMTKAITTINMEYLHKLKD